MSPVAQRAVALDPILYAKQGCSPDREDLVDADSVEAGEPIKWLPFFRSIPLSIILRDSSLSLPSRTPKGGEEILDADASQTNLER